MDSYWLIWTSIVSDSNGQNHSYWLMMTHDDPWWLMMTHDSSFSFSVKMIKHKIHINSFKGSQVTEEFRIREKKYSRVRLNNHVICLVIHFFSYNDEAQDSHSHSLHLKKCKTFWQFKSGEKPFAFMHSFVS